MMKPSKVTSQKSTIFDDWSDVIDCNECEEWWTNSCDGVSQGSERPCKTFKAIRRVSIPIELKRSQNAIKWLSGLLALSVLSQVILWFIILK